MVVAPWLKISPAPRSPLFVLNLGAPGAKLFKINQCVQSERLTGNS